MKTRIISGIVMGLIVAAVLAAGMLWNEWIIVFFVALLAAAAVYELTHNAAGIKSRAAVIGACVYAFLVMPTLCFEVELPKFLLLSGETAAKTVASVQLSAVALTVLYFLFAVCVTLKNHRDFSLASIVSLSAMPFLISYAFSCLVRVINHDDGLYYLLLLLNFSSVCDMGAYFVGSACGKHKLSPEISPKKTVEGSVGGVAASLVVSVILALCFGRTDALAWLLVLTVPFCVIGMLGDLFASAVKRSVGLKDYSQLIPGHGGILDRFDSILLIAPVLYLCVQWGIL